MVVAMREGMENRRAAGEGDVLALEELAQCRIVGDADERRRGLEREMEVANLPGETGGHRGLGGERDLEHGLGILREDVGDAAIAMDHVAVVEMMLEVESEFASIRRRRTPAAFRESEAIHGHRDREAGGGFGGGVVMDKNHDFLTTKAPRHEGMRRKEIFISGALVP